MVQPRDRVVLVSANLAPDVSANVSGSEQQSRASPQTATADEDEALGLGLGPERRRWRERTFSDRDEDSSSSSSHLRPLFSTPKRTAIAAAAALGLATDVAQQVGLSFRSEEGVQLELYVDPTWVLHIQQLIFTFRLVRTVLAFSPSRLLDALNLQKRSRSRSRLLSRFGARSSDTAISRGLGAGSSPGPGPGPGVGARMSMLVVDGVPETEAETEASVEVRAGQLRLTSRTVCFSCSEPGAQARVSATAPERSHAGGATASNECESGACLPVFQAQAQAQALMPAGEPLHLALTGETWSLLYQNDRELLMQVSDL